MRIYLVRHGQSIGNISQKAHEDMADHAIPLSTRGIRQAEEAGKFLADYIFNAEVKRNTFGSPGTGISGPDYGQTERMMAVTGQWRYHLRLWHSPYERTRTTAQGLQRGVARNDKSLITDVREHVLLCEQQFGLFDGVPDEELAERFPEEQAHYAKQEAFEGRFWARFPMGESRFDVAVRVHQAFGTFHRDAMKHNINDIIVVCHGVTMRAFLMMWMHYTPEWFEKEKNPQNCSIRLIEDHEDKGYIFDGFPSDDGVQKYLDGFPSKPGEDLS